MKSVRVDDWTAQEAIIAIDDLQGKTEITYPEELCMWPVQAPSHAAILGCSSSCKPSVVPSAHPESVSIKHR